MESNKESSSHDLCKRQQIDSSAKARHLLLKSESDKTE